LDTFRRLKQFFWPHKKSFFLSLFALFFVTAITVVYPIILQVTIDEVVLQEKFNLIPFISIAFLVAMLIKGIAAFFQRFLGV